MYTVIPNHGILLKDIAGISNHAEATAKNGRLRPLPPDEGAQVRTSDVGCYEADYLLQLKCDRHLTFPAPCSRCEKSQLHCSFDPLFKRTDRKQCVGLPSVTWS